jgi:hypothetical protein
MEAEMKMTTYVLEIIEDRSYFVPGKKKGRGQFIYREESVFIPLKSKRLSAAKKEASKVSRGWERAAITTNLYTKVCSETA